MTHGFTLEATLSFAEWIEVNASKAGEMSWRWRGDNWRGTHSTFDMFGHFIKAHPQHKGDEIVTDSKREWYLKLHAKLERIQRGEMTLEQYIQEVAEKAKGGKP